MLATRRHVLGKGAFSMGSLPVSVAARNIYGFAYNLAKKVVPKMSETERAALQAGTVGFDGELFTGNPKLSSLSKYVINLTKEEKSFLDNEVETLCRMVDDHGVQQDMDLPPQVWKYIKDNKFFGMIIPKEKGGLGFSAQAHSLVVQKISTRSATAAVTVSVPNSLGPAELLMKYGTDEQRAYYLPRLATGKDVPCFALTGPFSGSDAASMPDKGIVCRVNGELGVRLTFDKRYITLAPVANVVGLAFVLQDPEKLLGTEGKEGITLALLPRDTPGLQIGNRHDPLSVAFMNGTVAGKDVFVSMKRLIGGQKYAGHGWNMLMECLSEGRGISLPASSCAIGRGSVLGVGAYARIRKQFKIPIAELEGIQERLARIASETYVMCSATSLMNAMIDAHERPSVLSAVMKQQCTERGRIVVNEAMDVLAGAGICKGKRNFMATAYQAAPIAITVEGSNTLTRSLIIFGQGLVRSHPDLLNLLASVQKGDDLKGFKSSLRSLVSHAYVNAGRSLSRSVSRRRFQGNDLVGYYESQLSHIASAFAVSSDLALSLGGRLKTAEYLSGRFADVLSNLYLGYACLWYYRANTVQGIEPVVHASLQRILYDAQEALYGISANFPIRTVGWMIGRLSFPFGRPHSLPKDETLRSAASLITHETPARALLSQHAFVPGETEHLGQLARALSACVEADRIVASAKKNKTELTPEQKAVVDRAEALRRDLVQVDSFPSLGRAMWETSLKNSSWDAADVKAASA